ncbi:MAG: ribosomal protein S18-alanine N-acetyltransferase [Bacilli bacterium]|nr:ribosomal protein S18-alanine N-acetyltransferase [Bacilli bacterium]
MIIRSMEEKDLAAVLDINAISFISPWTQQQFLYEMKENEFAHLFVADYDGIVIGYIDFWITFDSGCINHIAVLPNLKRRGVGTILLTDAIARMTNAGVSNITLEVRHHNESAINFYKRHGFKEVCVKKSYYDNGDDAIYMMKEVGNNE